MLEVVSPAHTIVARPRVLSSNPWPQSTSQDEGRGGNGCTPVPMSHRMDPPEYAQVMFRDGVLKPSSKLAALACVAPSAARSPLPMRTASRARGSRASIGRPYTGDRPSPPLHLDPLGR